MLNVMPRGDSINIREVINDIALYRERGPLAFATFYYAISLVRKLTLHHLDGII